MVIGVESEMTNGPIREIGLSEMESEKVRMKMDVPANVMISPGTVIPMVSRKLPKPESPPKETLKVAQTADPQR